MDEMKREPSPELMDTDAQIEFRINRAARNADEVSALIENGKRVPRSMTEDLRNDVRWLIAALLKKDAGE